MEAAAAPSTEVPEVPEVPEERDQEKTVYQSY